jgi:hypothetical protein
MMNTWKEIVDHNHQVYSIILQQYFSHFFSDLENITLDMDILKHKSFIWTLQNTSYLDKHYQIDTFCNCESQGDISPLRPTHTHMVTRFNL